MNKGGVKYGDAQPIVLNYPPGRSECMAFNPAPL
jgi:hypothetical protein